MLGLNDDTLHVIISNGCRDSEQAVIYTSLLTPLFLFTHQEEFLSLCVDKLTEILTSDFLNVPNEEMVFEAAMLWLNKCPSRRQSFEKV